MYLNISNDIKRIFEENEMNDLKRFLTKRACLNTANSYLIYLFHFIQSAGILITSYGTGNNNQIFLWIGISLNFLATLIHVFEQKNNSLLKKLMHDINLIKNENYVDEGEFIDTETIHSHPSQKNQTISLPPKLNSLTPNQMAKKSQTYDTFTDGNIDV